MAYNKGSAQKTRVATSRYGNSASEVAENSFSGNLMKACTDTPRTINNAIDEIHSVLSELDVHINALVGISDHLCGAQPLAGECGEDVRPAPSGVVAKLDLLRERLSGQVYAVSNEVNRLNRL